jgi:hypothetical protein
MLLEIPIRASLCSMDIKNFDSLIAEAAEKMQQEAYAAGWRDAVAAMSSAMNDLPSPIVSGVFENPSSSNGAAAITPKGANSKLPKQGSTPWEVIQVVKKKPGLTATQVVEAVLAGGHNVPEGSIRTSIFRMKERKFIIARHGKWYPA